MPTWHVCNKPGCPTLTTTRHCPAHTQQQRRVSDSRRPNSRARGYDAKWEATRADHLTLEPWCQHPHCTRPATDVDHIDGLGPLGPRGHDHDNLQSLCHPHHSAKTARHDGGFGHPPGVPPRSNRGSGTV